MKDNAMYVVVSNNPTSRHPNVMRDEIIQLKAIGPSEKCPYQLRRIEFYDSKDRKFWSFSPTI